MMVQQPAPNDNANQRARDNYTARMQRKAAMRKPADANKPPNDGQVHAMYQDLLGPHGKG